MNITKNDGFQILICHGNDPTVNDNYECGPGNCVMISYDNWFDPKEIGLYQLPGCHQTIFEVPEPPNIENVSDWRPGCIEPIYTMKELTCYNPLTGPVLALKCSLVTSDGLLESGLPYSEEHPAQIITKCSLSAWGSLTGSEQERVSWGESGFFTGLYSYVPFHEDDEEEDGETITEILASVDDDVSSAPLYGWEPTPYQQAWVNKYLPYGAGYKNPLGVTVYSMRGRNLSSPANTPESSGHNTPTNI